MNYSIELNNISKTYGDVCALKNVNLQIHKGEIFGLIGLNGAGKSTLIKILVGLISPTSGGGSVLGFDIHQESHLIRENLGAMFENCGLYEYLTAFDNLDFFARIWHIPNSKKLQIISALSDEFGITDKLNQTVNTLSKGTKQKIAIIRALMHKPPIIILDEPTDGLDPVSLITFRNILTEISRDENTTIFINTHNLKEAELLCDVVGILNGGELLDIINIKEIHSNECIKVTIKENDMLERFIIDRFPNVKFFNNDTIITSLKDLNELVSVITSQQGEILGFTKENNHLENLFMRYIKNE